MGFLDSIKDALRGAVTGQASKADPTPAPPTIPDTTDTAETTDPTEEQAARTEPREEATFETYTVKTGDSLPEIGARFGVPHLEIARLNSIENPDLIFPGQVFRIPTS